MKAYKIWHDTKHYIHKNTTNELNVTWTENEEDAKDLPTFAKAVKFFNDTLGFSLNISRKNALYFTK